MSQSSSGAGQDTGTTRSRPRTVRVVLAFIAAVAILVSAYAWYALRRIDYFLARDARGLATLASQMGGSSRPGGIKTDTIPSRAESQGLARPLFGQSFLSVFDIVLLATPEGEVLYQTATTQPPPLPTLFAPADHDESKPLPTTGIILTNLSSLETQHGWSGTQPLNINRLRGSSGWTVIRLMDDDYYLFTHPVRFANHDPAKTAAKEALKNDDGADLLVGALVPQKKLQLQAISISNSKLSIVLTVVILLFCWYPYLRILLLPPGAPLRPVGVVLAAVSALCACAIMTLMLADTIVFQHLSDQEDRQLAVYGGKLRDDILRDILRSVVLSEGLRDWSERDVLTRNPVPPRIDHLENQEIWTIPSIWQQAYFQRMVWLDQNGTPLVVAVSKGTAPEASPSMKDRAFFKETTLGRWRTIGEQPKAPRLPLVSHRYVVEINQGLPDPEVTISVPAKNGRVIGVTVPFIHFIDPVIPPGFGFAVIDENGTVIFHSEKQRSLNESLFKESDDNRHLRASVYTRREAQVNGRYWGVDHQFYATPIPGTPWTAVAMRDETLLRTINTEAVALTAVLLALYAMLYALIFVALAVVKPTYRAPWLWPEAEREPEYLRAVWALLLECLAFLVSIVVIGSPEILTIAFLASVRGLATAFVIINRADRERHWLFGWWTSTVVTVAWLATAASGRIDALVMERFGRLFPAILLFVLVVLPWLVSLYRVSPAAKRRKTISGGLPRHYKLVGLGLLLVASVLPAIAFFNTAIRLGVDAQVKYTQIRLADLLERRLELLERINMRGSRVAFDCYSLAHVLNSAWTLDPRADTARPTSSRSAGPRPSAEMIVGDYRAGHVAPPRGIPRLVQRLLPRYSDSSVAVRELHFDTATDLMWRWWRKTQDLTLERVLVLDELTKKRLYSKDSAGLPTSAKLVIRSAIPAATLQDRLFGRASVPDLAKQLACPQLPDSDTGAAVVTELDEPPQVGHAAKPAVPPRVGLRPIAIILPLVILLTGWVLYQAVGFMGHRVFLFDVDEPASPPEGKIAPLPRLNLFVEVDAPTTAVVDLKKFHEIKVESIIPAQGSSWSSLLLDADKQSKNGILFVGFDKAFEQSWSSMTLLSLLEQFLQIDRHSIVILSQISIPAALATQSGTNRHRWQIVFDTFARLNRRTSAADETFESIWSSTSRAERLMLFQIARDGLANRRPANILRRLLVRNLVHFAPQLEFKLPEFETFVHKAARREGISDDESAATPPHWQPLKIALALLAGAAIILLLATQKDLINSTGAAITLLAAGIPVILRLVGLISGRPTRDLES
jgi:hypothetical protein